MSRWQPSGPVRALAIVLLLCALAIRVIVPQGYMWSTGASGAPEMVLCSGMAMPTEATLLAARAMAGHGGQHHEDGKTVDHPCAFAAASAAVDLAATLHPAPAAAPKTDSPVVVHLFARPGLGLAAPPPPKTGPPAAA